MLCYNLRTGTPAVCLALGQSWCQLICRGKGGIASAHLFTVSQAVGIRITECGVLIDVVRPGDGEWESSLAAMLTPSARSMPDPLT